MDTNIEQLERQLESTTDASARIQILNELAHHIRGVNPRRSVQLSEEAHALAREIGDDAGIAASLLGVGFGKMIRGEYADCLELSLEARGRFRELDDDLGASRADVYLGFAYRSLGVLDKSLEHYLSAQQLIENTDAGSKKERLEGLAWCTYGLAGVQEDLHDYEQALRHYKRCFELFDELDTDVGRSRALVGVGGVLMARGEHQLALEKLRASLEFSERTDAAAGPARSLTDIGTCLEALGQLREALDYNERALELREQAGLRDASLTNRMNIGRVYLGLGETAKATDVLGRARGVAEELAVKPKLFRIHELLARACEEGGNHEQALDHFQTFHRLEREVHSDEATTRVKNLQVASEVEIAEREAEIHRLRNVELARLNEQLQERNELIRQEQERSERLLHNILPAKIVRELQESGTTRPETFDNVTVFFSDFIDFTTKSATLEPATLITELNEIFTKFDEIAEKHGVERIKTIGDAYLAVCGMPRPNDEHATRVLRLAQEAVEYLEERNGDSEILWPIRIGVHTGRVVGGVVGIKKYIYDVFGDTINTASRMESHSESMRINVSESTYELAKEHFTFIPRDEIEVKGKGSVRMYFLDSA